jgi:hypothetical protein
VELLATVQVPEPDGPIIAAAGQLRPIGTAPKLLHLPLMCFAQEHALSALHIPPA